MFFYLGMYFLLIVMGFAIRTQCKGKLANNLFFMGSFLVMFLVQALRSEKIGEDLFVYVDWFKRFAALGWKKAYRPMENYVEPGYITFNLLVQSISKEPQVFIACSSFAILAMLLSFLYKNTDHYFDAVIIFIGSNVFTNSMTALRQFFAMGVVVWIIPMIEKKKYIRCLLLMLLAFNFHQSSMIFSVITAGLWLLTKYKSKRVFKYLFIGAAASIVILEVFVNFLLSFLPKYQIYFQHTENQSYSAGKLRMLIAMIEVFLIWYYTQHKELQSRHNNMIAMLVFVSAYIGILGNFIPHIFRLGYYFDIMLTLFIPVLIPRKTIERFALGKGLLYVGCTALYTYYLATNAAGIVPYEFCFA